jgi:hypothetical protein
MRNFVVLGLLAGALGLSACGVVKDPNRVYVPEGIVYVGIVYDKHVLDEDFLYEITNQLISVDGWWKYVGEDHSNQRAYRLIYGPMADRLNHPTHPAYDFEMRPGIVSVKYRLRGSREDHMLVEDGRIVR